MKKGDYFYTADTHFGYERILKMCDRPFKDVDEMNQEIVRKFNSRCGSADTIFFVGDIAAAGVNPVPILKKIRAKKILIVGNHDLPALKHRTFRECFEDIRSNALITDGSYDIFLSHYPMVDWDGMMKGRFLFYGHSHKEENGGAFLMRFLPTAINVGVDMNSFLPKTAEELIKGRLESYKIPSISVNDVIDRVIYADVDDRSKKKLDYASLGFHF